MIWYRIESFKIWLQNNPQQKAREDSRVWDNFFFQVEELNPRWEASLRAEPIKLFFLEEERARNSYPLYPLKETSSEKIISVISEWKKEVDEEQNNKNMKF